MIQIDFINETNYPIEDKLKKKIEKALDETLSEENVTQQAEVTVSFVTPETIHELNRTYRSVDRTTDVLSFPVFSSLEEIYSSPKEFPVLLGDIILNPTRAEEQAEENGQSFETEIVYLSIHSILHLLGYDHMEEDEKRIMRQHEKEILRRVQAS